MTNLTTSEVGINLVQRFEGIHKKTDQGDYRSYRCPAGRWTIGWGHIRAVRSGQRATHNECVEFLRQDLEETEAAVLRLVKVDLTQNQFDSLVSFVFNLGQGNFKSSSLLRKLNSSDFNGVPEEFLKWNKARVSGKLTTLAGLSRRRSAEAALFMLDVPLADDDPSHQMPQKPEARAIKSLVKSKTIAGAGVAGVGTMGSVISDAATQVKSLTQYSDSLQILFLILSVVGIGLVTYSRVMDHKKGVH